MKRKTGRGTEYFNTKQKCGENMYAVLWHILHNFIYAIHDCSHMQEGTAAKAATEDGNTQWRGNKTMNAEKCGLLWIQVII